MSSSYKITPFLLLSLLVTVMLALGEGDIPSLTSLLEYKYIMSIGVWTFSFFIILSLAYIINTSAAVIYRYIYLASFILFLLLAGKDSANEGADSMFFEMAYPANGLCIIFYGGILFGVLSFVNFLGNMLMHLLKNSKARAGG